MTAPRRTRSTPSSQSYSSCSLLRALWSSDCKVASALCLFLNIAVVRCYRNYIASAAFSALLEDRLARLRMHYDYIYNRIEFYLALAVAKKYFHIFFVKKVLVIILILLYNGTCKQFNTTHQERWREWPCEVAATIAV